MLSYDEVLHLFFTASHTLSSSTHLDRLPCPETMIAKTLTKIARLYKQSVKTLINTCLEITRNHDEFTKPDFSTFIKTAFHLKAQFNFLSPRVIIYHNRRQIIVIVFPRLRLKNSNNSFHIADRTTTKPIICST